MADPIELTEYSKKILDEKGYDWKAADKPTVVPPVEIPEYFPGFGKELQQLGVAQMGAQKRVIAAQQTLSNLQRSWGFTGPLRLPSPGESVYPITPFLGIVTQQDFEARRLQAQQEMDLALQAFKATEWRQEVMTTLPNYLSLPDYKVQSADDILQLIPLDTLTDADSAWLTVTLERLKHLSNVLPEGFDGDAIEAQTKILNEILTAPKLELKAVHNLTVDEIAKSFAFGVADLPKGMTEEDVRYMLGKMELEDEEMQSAKDWLASRAKDWALETDRLNLIRAGTVLAEAPELTPLEFGKLLVTQPMMATVQLLDKYFNLLPRPLVSAAIIGVHRTFKTPDDTAAGRLEEQYAHFKSMGLSSWEAYATAFNEWDANWALKLGTEIVFDPVSYIGLGFATAAAYKVGYGLTKLGVRAAGTRIGPWVGAIENGYITGADAIFKTGVKGVLAPIKGAFWLTGAGYQIPRTFTMMARNFARDSYMKFSSVLQKTFPEVRNMKGLTVKDAVDAGTNAIDQAIARPMEGHDAAVIAGAPMLEFDYIDDVVAARMTREVVAGGVTPAITPKVVAKVAVDLVSEVEFVAPRIAGYSPAAQAILKDFAEDFGMVMIGSGKKYRRISDVIAALEKTGLTSKQADDARWVVNVAMGDWGAELRAARVADEAARAASMVKEAPIVTELGITFDTPRLARLNNEVLNMFSGQGERITAGKIIADLGQEATEDMVNKMATKLVAFKEKVVKSAKESLKGDNATDVLMSQFNRLERIRYGNLNSPLTKYMQQAGRTASWHSRVADRILYSSALVALERRLVMPIARWNLLFTNFGPYNFGENMGRSFLGGAEIMYPKAYSGVHETNRLFKGLANAPYELQMFERGEQRLAQALIDPKTGRTAVFKDGKVPFITKQVVIPEKIPFLGGKTVGKKINIAGRDHMLASFQDGYDMWAHFNSMQVAFDYQTHYMKELAKIAPDDIGRLTEILATHRGKLAGVKAISSKDAKDIERVLLQDATVSPEGIRAHANIDVLEFERRQISKDLGRTFDKCTDVRSTTKKGIQDDVLDGSIFDDIDSKMSAYIEQERELSLISLKNQIAVLTDEADALLANPPRNLDEFLGDMQNITAMVEGTGERIHDYRKLTELRKANLLPGEMDDFEVGSAKLLAEFMETSEEQLTKIMNRLVENARGAYIDITTLPGAVKAGTAGKVSVSRFKDAELKFLNQETVDAMAKGYREGSQVLLKRPIAIIPDGEGGITIVEGHHRAAAAKIVGVDPPVSVIAGSKAAIEGLNAPEIDALAKKIFSEQIGEVTAKPLLNEIQLVRLTDLDSITRLEMENMLATRNKVAQIESIIPRTPKKSRNDRFWSQQRSQKSTIWDEFDNNARKFKSMRLRSSRNFLQSVDKSVYVPDFVPEVVDFLTPNHLAYLYGATGDDLYRGLTRIQHHATIRPREDFVLHTVEQADAYAATLGKTAGDIGFTDEAIGEVYDQLWRNLGVEPSILTPDSPTVMQMEEIRQEITRLHGALKIPGDPLLYHGTTPEAARLIEKGGFRLGEGGILGDGVYITGTMEQAERFGVEALPVLTSAKNIYKVDITNSVSFRKFLADIGESPSLGIDDIGEWVTYAGDRIKAKGYDALEMSADLSKIRGQVKPTKGFTVEDMYDEVMSTLGTPYQMVVFDPKMVRAAKGNYPDIVNYRQYINSVADDVEKLPMYRKPIPEAGRASVREIWDSFATGDREVWARSARLDISVAKRKWGNISKGQQDELLVARAEIAPEVPTTASADWWTSKEKAMTSAREQHALSYPTYDDANIIDEGMRALFPFWNYEMFRWRWLPRTALRTPGAMTGVAKYVTNTDQGYIPVPGTDLQMNMLRGSVWMGGLRSFYLRDFPEYYDVMPGMEFIDYIGRAGFFPGIHVMLPIVLFGAATGKPEFGQLAPAWMRTGLSGLRTLSPEHIGAVLEHIYPDRFRDYMTMLTLGSEGYDADEIWRKKQSKEKLTPEEEELWLKATARVDGVKGILMQQTGLFRIRPQEFTDIRKEMRLAIEEATGVPISVQEQIDHNYPVTGKRFSDYYKLDAYQTKLLYEWETYRRWQGVTTPLYPSSWQLEDIRRTEYYQEVERVYEEARNVGIYEDGELVRPSIIEANRQWVEGEIGPDQWKALRSDIQGGLADAVRVLGESPAYKDVPKTFEEMAKRLEERGIPSAVQTPDQELLYYYYELRPEYKWNWESNRMERDFDTYYAYVDILLESLAAPYRERLLERIQSDWTPLEQLYWQVSREYVRPYRNLRDIVLQQYSPEEIQQIRRYEVAPAAEREAIQEILGPDGDKLISGYQRTLREARQRLRILDPNMDAWLNFFGITTSLLSTEAEVKYEEMRDKYLIKEMIQ